jgi:Tol biopolymer transport system component
VSLAVLAAVLLISACGSYDDPNAVIGGRKELLVENGSDPTWSPDGGRIVFARLGHLYLMEYPGGQAEPLTSISGEMVNADFNPVPDTNELVFIHKPAGAEQALIILDIDAFSIVEVYRDTVELVDACFSRDGLWIIFRSESQSGIYRVKPEPGRQPELIFNPLLWKEVSFHQASPFNDTILYVESRIQDDLSVANLYRIEIGGFVQPDRLTGVTGGEDPAWKFGAAAESYDGAWIAVAGSFGQEDSKQTLWLLPSDITDGSLEDYKQITEVADGEVGSLAWSPDNRRLVVDLDGDLWIIEPDM